MSDRQTSVSIVCVYNDLAVRQHCLDRSIQERRMRRPMSSTCPSRMLAARTRAPRGSESRGVTGQE